MKPSSRAILWAVALLVVACTLHGPIPGLGDDACDDANEPAMACPARAADAPQGRTELRVLVLTTDGTSPSYGAILSALDRLGIAYDVIAAATVPLSAERLSSATASCGYRGVILDVSGLPMQDGDDYVSALSDAEWQELSDYEVRCGAREVVWYAYPSPDLGLELRGERDGVQPVLARVTPGGEATFPYLRPGADLAFQGGYAYLASVIDPAATTALVATAGGDVLAAVHRRPDGREVLAMTVDSADFSIHAKLLEHGVLSWLMRGLFVGERRVYLSPQVDDVFIPNFVWMPGVGETRATFRMSGDDLRALAAWQVAVAGRLPAGSRFVTTLAMNGVGTTALYPDTELERAGLELAGQFDWVNHTWDHTNMDVMSAAGVRTEIERNVAYAVAHKLPRFDPSAAVTPEVSGLDNRDAVAAMVGAGVRVVVSDASITPALRPTNPGANPVHNVGRQSPHDACLYQVPRHPTELYVNSTAIDEEVDHFNLINREDRGRELGYEAILADESEWALRLLLDGDIDPLMFHQSNLRTWQQGGAAHSLYSDWIDAALARYTALVRLPVLSLPLPDIGRAMRARGALARCAARATLVNRDGATSLEIRVEDGTCVVPITGLAAPAAGTVEVYGGVPTTWVAVERCKTTTIPL